MDKLSFLVYMAVIKFWGLLGHDYRYNDIPTTEGEQDDDSSGTGGEKG